MQEETLRLQSKLHKLEDVLEKQRWTQKEQALKFEKAVNKLERELEDEKFQAQYNKEQIQRYQLVLNNLNEGIYAMDSDGNVFAMNEKAKELLDEDAITPVLLEASSGENIQRTIDSSINDYSPDESETECGAAPRMVTISARPLRDEEGKIVGSVAVVRAVTGI